MASELENGQNVGLPCLCFINTNDATNDNSDFESRLRTQIHYRLSYTGGGNDLCLGTRGTKENNNTLSE